MVVKKFKRVEHIWVKGNEKQSRTHFRNGKQTG